MLECQSLYHLRHVYLVYRPDIDFIKNTPLNLDFALALPPFTHNRDKLRLVIASHKASVRNRRPAQETRVAGWLN